METPHIILKHTDKDGKEFDDVKVVLDELDRQNTWLQHVVLLPWATPQRLIGFVHPAAELGKEPFVLHAAFMFMGGVSTQQKEPGRTMVMATPRLILPYELVSPIDVDIYSCPAAVHLSKQGPEFREHVVALMRMQFFPPQIKVATPDELPPTLVP